MSKVAVVYWSGTGNTEAMANQVVEGAKNAGAEVSLFTAAEFSSEKMDAFDAVAFGCPSMGAEQLEESEFEPMFTDCEAKLSGKKIALFGLETRKGTVANKMATVPFLCRRVRVPRIFHCDIVSKIFHLPLDKESFLYYHMNSYSYERM